jgi:ferric-dicitrate binding protein FerR (iron transport regulator)
METENTYPIDLITLYLAGEASSDDLAFLEAWLKADPGNRKIFEEYRQSWMEIEMVRMDTFLDTDKEWNKLHEKLFSKEVPEHGKIISFYSRKVLRIAAIVLLLVIPSVFVIRYFTRPLQNQMNASLSIKEGKLPDGSSVTLNKGTTLEYPFSFKGDKRNVKLSGEAYFEVKHDDAKPFIVTSHNVKVEVLGTSFYVNTNASNNTMEVIVNSGSVAIYFDDHKENALFLSPGEKARINPGQEKMGKDINTDPNYMSWMTQRFIYNNEPLIKIVADLNKVYHTNLYIATPAVSNCLVTVTFDHQSVESILHVLQATLDLNISNHGTWTDISGNKCN